VSKLYLVTIGEHGQDSDVQRTFFSKRAALDFVVQDTDLSELSALRLFRRGVVNIDERNSGVDTGGRPNSWYAKIERIL